jgi:hypothetical protein
MAPQELGVRRRLRRESRRGADRFKQVDPWPKAARREGMRGPEVVRHRARPEGEEHRGTIRAVERVYTTPLLDKLGIRPGMRVAILGVDDDAIRDRIAERTTDLTEGWPATDTDVVLLAADSTDELAPLVELATRIRPNGAIWVVSRKGKAATIRDVEVIAAAKAAGLVDNKVASFSPTHTSLRLVIPVDRRR